MESIQDNIQSILNKIQIASSGRSDIKLVAVSKNRPVNEIIEAYNAGQYIFGENKVQEAREKVEELPQDIDLHFIGKLQKNKAKYCPKIFSVIHSLDKIEVANILSRKSEELGKKLDVLIQVNFINETTKSGIRDKKSLSLFIEQLILLANIRVVGLMTMPDPSYSSKLTSKVYSDLYKLNLNVAREFGLENQMKELSMGMSQDFEIAINEGATYVRIGSAIFD